MEELGIIKVTVERGSDKLTIEFDGECTINEWIDHLKVLLKWVGFADETIKEAFADDEV